MQKYKKKQLKQQQIVINFISVQKLEINRGQLYGLPKNPRFIKDSRFEALKKSIQDAPEMLALRELLVYPLENGNYIVIGGNMRLQACIELGYKELPCKIIPLETPVAKLREYVIKDNIGFGQDDTFLLLEEWNKTELEDFGIEMTSFQEVNLDDFFSDEKIEKKQKELICPHCGMNFYSKENENENNSDNSDID